MYTYSAKIVRWVDGDTFDAEVDVGFSIHYRNKFRVIGINAPEMSTPEGLPAKQYAQELAPEGSTFLIRTTKPDKYGRWLADILLSLDGKSFASEMVAAGQAVPYMV